MKARPLPQPCWAVPCLPPVPLQGPAKGPAVPLSVHPNLARWGTVQITYRRPSEAAQPPVRQCPPVLPCRAAGLVPEGRPLMPKIKPARPSDLSAGALPLPLTGKHLPEAMALSGQPPSSAGGDGPLQGSPQSTLGPAGAGGAVAAPGATQSELDWVQGASQALHQLSLQKWPAASRRCPPRCHCT